LQKVSKSTAKPAVKVKIKMNKNKPKSMAMDFRTEKEKERDVEKIFVADPLKYFSIDP